MKITLPLPLINCCCYLTLTGNRYRKSIHIFIRNGKVTANQNRLIGIKNLCKKNDLTYCHSRRHTRTSNKTSSRPTWPTLSPKNDVQKALQTRLIQIANDIAQARMLLFVSSGDKIPIPFLTILIFWLTIIFASFTMFTDLNKTVSTYLALFAFAASCGIFLILELSHPFTGIMTISSEPLRNALAPLNS